MSKNAHILEKYKPTNMILASMKPVPINIKKELTTISVIDNLEKSSYSITFSLSNFICNF